MNEETVTLGQREQKRALVLNQVVAGLATVEEAALLLGRSVRQMSRLKAAYQAAGPASLVHGNRGRSTAWALAPEVAARIGALARGPYAGINQQRLARRVDAHRSMTAAERARLRAR